MRTNGLFRVSIWAQRPHRLGVGTLSVLILTLMGWGAGHAAANPLVLEAAKAPAELRLDTSGFDARSWRLDSAVFTEITPFTAPDIAIKLPEYGDDDPSQTPSQAQPGRQNPAPEAPER